MSDTADGNLYVSAVNGDDRDVLFGSRISRSRNKLAHFFTATDDRDSGLLYDSDHFAAMLADQKFLFHDSYLHMLYSVIIIPQGY